MNIKEYGNKEKMDGCRRNLLDGSRWIGCQFLQ